MPAPWARLQSRSRRNASLTLRLGCTTTPTRVTAVSVEGRGVRLTGRSGIAVFLGILPGRADWPRRGGESIGPLCCHTQGRDFPDPPPRGDAPAARRARAPVGGEPGVGAGRRERTDRAY